MTTFLHYASIAGTIAGYFGSITHHNNWGMAIALGDKTYEDSPEYDRASNLSTAWLALFVVSFVGVLLT
jgi:hypothetical protein